MKNRRGIWFRPVNWAILLVSMALSAGRVTAAVEEPLPEAQVPAAAQESIPKEGSIPLKQVSGRVVSIDEGENLLKVKSGLLPITTDFLVEWKTTILAGNRAMRLGDLRPGDLVTIEFAKKEGKNVARAISVKVNGPSRG